MLYLRGRFKNCAWAIWKIEETEQQLLDLLEHKEWLEKVNICTSQIRKLEMLAVRVLLKTMLNREIAIHYEETGKPFLKDEPWTISISHTKNMVAVCLNKQVQSTLDIEQCTDKVLRVKSKFVDSSEFIDLSQERKHLLLFWTAKEAMCKYVNNKSVDFKQHFHIANFKPLYNTGYFEAKEILTEKRQKFDAFYYISKSFVLTVLNPQRQIINPK